MAMTWDQACAAVCAPGSMFEITEAEVRGATSKIFAMAPPNIRAVFALAAMNEGEFIVYEDDRWTMTQVLEMAGRIGHTLVDTWGIEKGDRVALASRNYPEWIAAFVAIVSTGAVAVPLNAWWLTDELEFAIADSGAKVVLADDERLERIMSGTVPDGVRLVAIRSNAEELAEGVTRLEDALVDGTTMPEVEIAPDDNISILYTSGTTGRPKGAVSTHRAVINALLAFAARATVGAVMDGVDPTAAPDPDAPQTTFMLPVPLFHVTGLVPVMLGSFVTGAKLVMTHRWDPDRALELIEREKVTNFVGVPTMSWDLLEADTFDQRDTSSLQSVGGGGAPMPPELVQRIEDNFSQGRPGLGYGMTETNAYGPQNAGTMFVENPTSTGKCVPVMDVRVTDAEGNVLPTGETGEIWFSGPMLISEYWNRPEATAETMQDGWLRSGDLGHVDEDGFVYVSDRAKAVTNFFCHSIHFSVSTQFIHNAVVIDQCSTFIAAA